MYPALRNARLSLSAVVALAIGATASAEEFQVLMIGNSYTSGQSGVPDGGTSDDVQGLLDADPNHSGSVTERAPGGATLRGHTNDPMTTDLITDTATHQWDVIVLQERSTRPGLAMKLGGAELDGLDLGGPVLIDLIRTFQPQARVVLFNTWARAHGNPELVADFDNDPRQMLGFTNEGYDRIRANPPAWDHADVATIARVGDAWESWACTHGTTGAAPLHVSDGSHQSGLGSYLAAAVLFEVITGDSSVGNPFAGSYLGGVNGSIDGVPLLQLLQEQASRTTGLLPTPGLAPGDVVILGLHGDGTSSAPQDGDAFSWAPLVDLSPGEVLYFSDVSYFRFRDANCGFGATEGSFEEGLVRYTTPAAGLAAGTVLTLNPMNDPGADYEFVPGNAYSPAPGQDWINLSSGGDQLVVFQDDDVADADRFRALFAVTTATLDWDAAQDTDPGDIDNGGTGNECTLYPGLTDGQDALAVGAGSGSMDELDNARYVGPTRGTRAELLAAIAELGNWERTDVDQSLANGGPGSGIWTRNGVSLLTVELEGSVTPYCFCDAIGPCLNDDPDAGCANSSGTGARLSATGSVSASADDLGFAGTNLLPGQPALLFVGLEALNGGFGLPFGDGRRCAGTGVVRLGVSVPDALGDVGWGPDLGALGGWGPGDVRRFQAWYRDPSNGPCGTGFNLTHAVEVDFGS